MEFEVDYYAFSIPFETPRTVSYAPELNQRTDNRIRRLENMVQHQANNIASLKQHVAPDKTASLQAELAKLSTDYETKLEQLRVTKSTISALVSALQTANISVTENTVVDGTLDVIRQLKTIHKQLADQIDATTTVRAELSKRLAQSTDEKSTLASTLEKANEEIRTLTSELTRTRQMVEDRGTQLQASASVVAELEKTRAEMQSYLTELTSLKSQRDQLLQQVNKDQRNINSLTDKLKEATQERDQKISDLTSELDRVRQTSSNQLSAITRNRNRLDTSQVALAAKLDGALTNLKRAQAERNQKVSELDRVRQASSNQLSAVTRNLEQVVSDKQRAQAERNQKILELTSKLEQANASVRELESAKRQTTKPLELHNKLLYDVTRHVNDSKQSTFADDILHLRHGLNKPAGHEALLKKHLKPVYNYLSKHRSQLAYPEAVDQLGRAMGLL